MDFGALAGLLTTALVPVLPYLLKLGETAAEETGKTVANKSLEWAKSLWTKLQPKVDEKPRVLEAAQEAALNPKNEGAQGALRWELEKLLKEDRSFAEEISRLLEQGRAAGNIVTASGERSVAIGGNVSGSSINTGDQHKP